MPKSPTDTVSSFGHWGWNNETQSLEFTSFEPPAEVQENKTTKTSTYQEQFRNHLHKWQRNTVGAAQLNAFKTSIKRSQKTHVTIHDVKLAAVSLIQRDEFPIPTCFLSLLKSKELDEFLACVLLYFSCYFEKKALEEIPNDESVSERQKKAEIFVKVEMAQKQLALSYAMLLLGKGPCGLFPQHRTAGVRGRQSSTHSDIQLDECLLSFCSYAAWVTFERRDLKGIQIEIGRLFRSDTFNPALRTESEECDEKQKDQDSSKNEGQSEVMNPRKAAENDRKSNRRPTLNSIITQRSPLMASLLPTPQEQAPHLFGNFRRLKQGLKCSNENCNLESVKKELNQQLTSLCFGILGKPLSQFSSESLKLQGSHSEGEKEDEEDEGVNSAVTKNDSHVQIKTSKTSVTAQRLMTTTTDRHSRCGRADSVSRATTEEVNSDTE
ncbi:protein phosphatase 1 regulatory subunit 36 [Triplophysa dalaica]|uniref:protein phosphatase 1 regulatory subunit 36 n=1 Tax=Triplophysa dalaica TaxID=1582913 RepID=UPI0024DFBEC2|nr:protein phosphatase 1 regulatory subunit 36 [Triplophysa dalaica]XP_056597715.1 protein phosphatase 1 regulatory subunit 36 [Triplophysa dalaica]